MNITSQQNPAQFRATANNEHGVPYYKSNKGTVAGAIMAVPAVLLNAAPADTILDKFVKSDLYKELLQDMEKTEGKAGVDKYKKQMEEAIRLAKATKKYAIPFAIIAGACTLGAGMLYDKIRNDKAKRAATDIARNQYTTVYANGGEVGTSVTGAPYYKSTNGVKYGLLSGAVCGIISGAMSCAKIGKFGIGNMLTNTAMFSLGGLIMGSIAQKSANKAAEKSTYYA